ncbi:uncharacterized protein PHALS_12898 [Plasmopara halstedii]|uniref:Uncharacterized protein n=1 Tax=Plasmopara halstedii TaxID=4781 RepID=A0A0P1AMN3_PLAHL|nr:uncharacterized protein PHALS_12898 [Plasmopara halstedii]CEG42640.1 hypothetical protein PHALS_12898 [Plasmopara halstedii]|eukprot:XP_024579009.1 hypothetical protein PHALS_12898 [Plasmopara halstedii]
MQRLPPRAWARPALYHPVPPPPRGIVGPPYLYPRSLIPDSGYYPRFVPSPIPDTEQLWLESFRRTHCSQGIHSKDTPTIQNEPPFRLIRRRVVQAQTLALQLKVAASELAAVEKRLESSQVETLGEKKAQLCIEHKQITAKCEALKRQLDAMNAVSGIFTKKQLAEFRAFAARVQKKKTYRKRLKVRRRAEASIRQAVDVKLQDEAETYENYKSESVIEENKKQTEKQNYGSKTDISEPTTTSRTMENNTASAPTLDPEKLTMDSLIEVRRAWDQYIVLPTTYGASFIPPYFVPPPPNPSAQWAVYVSSDNANAST